MCRIASIFLAMVAILNLARGASAAPLQCGEIPGADRLLRPGAVVLVGEIHGTQEGPGAVADLACLALDRDLAVTAGLEIPVSDQAAVDLFLGSKGTADDRTKLISTRFWQSDYQDGRASAAMLELIETLRQHKSEGGDVRIVLFDKRERIQSRDRSMAEVLATSHPPESTSLLIALTGNLHSQMTEQGDSGPMGFELGRLLRSTEIISLRLTHGGGTAWICTPDECGVVKLRGREATAGIEIGPGPTTESGVGTIHVGEISASPPAKGLQPTSSP